MRPIITLIVTLGLTSLAGSAEAKSFFKFKIPNGSVNNCSTCHVSTSNPVSWNAFGEDVLDTLVGLQPDWAALCPLDSDGDGATNGEELLDPNCEWVSGADPGSSADVTNPGDPNDFPAEPEPEPEPEPDSVIESDVEEAAEDAGPGPEPDGAIAPDVDTPSEDAGEAPEPDDVVEADVEAPSEDAGEAPEPDDAVEVSDASDGADTLDAEAEPAPEPDSIDEPSAEDTLGHSDASNRHSEPECFDESECPGGSLCIDYVCVSQDGWTAPEPGGQDDAEAPGPDEDAAPEEQEEEEEEEEEGDDSQAPAVSEDEGGCQGGRSSTTPALLALFALVALLNRGPKTPCARVRA